MTQWALNSHRQNLEKTVICTKDKDLDMISGLHYNWTKDKEPYEVSEQQALKAFYSQLLTGDRVDNIQGIKGIGNKKAEDFRWYRR